MGDERRHPPAYRLDELAAGSKDSATLSHIDDCAACRDYVERSKHAAAAFARARAIDATVVVERARLAEREDSKARTQARLRIIAGASLTLSLAAGVALVVARPGSEQEFVAPHISNTGTTPDLERSGDLRFKGKLQLAAIVNRNGLQQRVTHDVLLRPRDSLRVEVSVDQAQEIIVAFIGDDGTYVELMTADWLQSGAHLSESALRFDDTPTAGRIVAGSPAAVRRAREQHDSSEVATLVLRARAEHP